MGAVAHEPGTGAWQLAQTVVASRVWVAVCWLSRRRPQVRRRMPRVVARHGFGAIAPELERRRMRDHGVALRF